MSHFSNAAKVATASVMLATLTGCGDIGGYVFLKCIRTIENCAAGMISTG